MKSSNEFKARNWNLNMKGNEKPNSTPKQVNQKELEGLLKTIDQNCLKSQPKRPKSPDALNKVPLKSKIAISHDKKKLDVRPISPPSNDVSYNSIKRIRCDSSLNKSSYSKTTGPYQLQLSEQKSGKVPTKGSKTPQIPSKAYFSTKTEESYKTKSRNSFSDKNSERKQSVGTVELNLSLKKSKILPKDSKILKTSSSKEVLNYRTKSNTAKELTEKADSFHYSNRKASLKDNSAKKYSTIQTKMNYKNYRNDNSNSVSADNKSTFMTKITNENLKDSAVIEKELNQSQISKNQSYMRKSRKPATATIRSSPRLPISNPISNNTSNDEISIDDVQDYQVISHKLHKLENKIIDIKKNIESKRKSRGGTVSSSKEDFAFSEKESVISKQESVQKKSFTEFDYNWKEQLKREVLFREQVLRDQVIKTKSLETKTLRSKNSVEKEKYERITLSAQKTKQKEELFENEGDKNVKINLGKGYRSSKEHFFPKGYESKRNDDSELVSNSPNDSKYKSFTKSMKFHKNNELDQSSKEFIEQKRKALIEKFSKLESTSKENISKSEKELKIRKMQNSNDSNLSMEKSEVETQGNALKSELNKAYGSNNSNKESAYLINCIQQAKSNLSKLKKTREEQEVEEIVNDSQVKVESELSKALKRMKESRNEMLQSKNTSNLQSSEKLSFVKKSPQETESVKSSDLNSFVTKVNTLPQNDGKIKMTKSKFFENESQIEVNSNKLSLINSQTSSTFSKIRVQMPKFYIAKMIKAFVSNGQDYFSGLFREHMNQCVQSACLVKGFSKISTSVLVQKQISLPKLEYYRSLSFPNSDKKTLIFDLDETLVHCNDSTDIESDIVVPVVFPTGEVVQAGINIRPYVKECLTELAMYYEIIVFTASHSCYANVVIDYLDPQKKIIKHRLYREHCIYSNEGLYIKDLRVINRDMKDMILVDNAFYSFGNQINNGLPILPYYFDKRDNELKDLTEFLKDIHNVVDVREEIKRQFRMESWGEFDNAEDAIKQVFHDLTQFNR